MPIFSSEDEFVALRPLKFGGKEFAAGQIFPWKKFKCTLRKLKLLHDGRRIIPKSVYNYGKNKNKESQSTPVVETVETKKVPDFMAKKTPTFSKKK